LGTDRPIPQHFGHFNIELDGFVVEQVSDTKFLGVYLEDKLSWIKHISQIRLKLARGTGIMSRVRHIVPRKVLVMLYHTLIYPYLVF